MNYLCMALLETERADTIDDRSLFDVRISNTCLNAFEGT